jgi:hypothetical protein
MPGTVHKNQAANGPTDGETPAGQAKKKPTPGGNAAPAAAGRLQPGEELPGPLSVNPPRGVDELPADARADDEAVSALQEHIQEVIDAEEEQGFRGVKTQVVPNENYTLGGVAAGKPTPETEVHTPRSAK